MVGRVMLGRYRIMRHLADGGMGAIYLGRNEGAAGFVRPVVIKWVLPSHAGDKRVTDLFMREARIMARLSHPNIVSVLDFSDEDGMYIMALEYVHGFTFGRWARFVRKTRGAFPVEFAIHVAIRVLHALDYAHNLTGEDGMLLRIVHRDVTPSNVLLDVQGNVKLADFGIAGIASEKTSVGDNNVKGKFAYMPPESFDRVAASAITDVYSVAIMLHEILSGKNELSGDSMAETVGLVIKHVPTRLDTLRDDISTALASVIATGFAKNPKDRYQSAQAFAQALEQTRKFSEAQVAEDLKAAISQDFHDPKLATWASMPQLAELEAAWHTPVTGLPPMPKRTSSPVVAVAPPPDVVQPAMAGVITAVAPPPPPKTAMGRGMLIGIIAGALTVIGLGIFAVISLLGSKDKHPPEEPAYIVVDHGPPPTAVDAAVREPANVVIDAPPAIPPTPSDAAPSHPVRPANPADQLTNAFAKHASAVTACFRQHPTTTGGAEISLRFHVATDGHVAAAEVLPAAIAATELGTCLEQVARAATFGAQPAALTFRVPLHATTD